MTADLLKNNLAHSRAAYLHAVHALPSPEGLLSGEIRQHGFVFERPSQITSQLIELGWAFFPRYEGCLEKWLKDQDVKLTKQRSLEDWLTSHEVNIPTEFSDGLRVYRNIRNALHHNDGASFDLNQEAEIHLLPDNMERFFSLFCWVGEQVSAIPKTDRH